VFIGSGPAGWDSLVRFGAGGFRWSGLGLREGFEKFTNRLPEEGMDEATVELGERTERKLPEMQFRMWDYQRWSLDYLGTPEQDVQIYEPGAVAKARFSSYLSLYSFQFL
jgi:hypothetical protein